MLDDAWYGYTVGLTTLLSIHAWIDAVCTVATLFPNLQWERAASVYSSLFLHNHVREDPLACRLLIYTVAAMGLVRVAAVVVPFNPVALFLASIMYLLEMLICLYEMDTAHTAHRVIASRGACSALFMAGAAAVQAVLSLVFA